jgi:non-canonical poly(A) RNA polymerase PAPD5/7
MKPSRTRLTCRAHNRFSPSIVLWQHFVGPGRPLLSSQRPSSTAAEPTQDGAVNNAQLEAQNTPTGPEQHGESSLKIRRLTTARGTWHPSKVETSIARNLQHVYATRQSSMNAPERLLATARAAFAEGRDYDGVVVQPMQHPTSVNERALPWSLAEIERGTMAGFDR